MKILFIAHRIPFPPNKGEKIRTFHQLRYLNNKHDVFLCFIVDDKRDLGYTACLNDYCNKMVFTFISTFYNKCKALLMSLFSQKPLTLRFFYSKTLQQRVHQILTEEQFDLVIASCSSVAQYIPQSFKPKVMDLIDIDSDKWLQYAQFTSFPKRKIYQQEAKRMAKYEKHLLDTWERCYVISPQEAQIVDGEKRLHVLANGVDLDYFDNLYENRGCDIVFVGTMNYFPNVDAMIYFCNEIWPYVVKKHPKVKLYIVGRDPSPCISELRSDNIIVTGAVEDIRLYLQKAKLAIAPIRIARGVQNKVLEYIACGLPCVISPQAAEGIDLSNLDSGIWIENNATTFAQRINSCLEENIEIPTTRREIFAQKYSWETHLANWEKDLLEIVAESKS
ncbi:TIGR03087 family PEP-CTERM/XrtA system glycosyltransferase [Candidatus Uabimicrobium amorphum]|uniref:Glycosyl transferase n=1 Tax=Uabimicrobium amorphum TaxID=2596890 RepID=A0A5S9F3J8_UABAM|nr:TIGR03087 family PEP-CTERM/XrtA system glycosyltransferase [Candidatus Uabimicrobium amorphum]BBM84815.1 glycosyl transferase [Candidatus Uabimicrobium amorphum]